MNTLNIFLIAVALAMDAFAVAIAAGIYLKQVSFRQTFRLSWHFGLFQALMPVMGWSAGLSVKNLIESYDHWAAFGLLAFVALNMARGALLEEKKERKDPTRGFTLVLLAIATSIDALAVGFSFSILNVSIWLPALITGLVAGLFTVIGLQISKLIGGAGKISKSAELAGSFVLLAIGLRILYEHGVF